MIDTGGTIVQAAEALCEHGAAEVIVAATHAVLSGPAVDRLKNSPITEVIVTNTLPITEERSFDELTVLSIAPLIARAIREVFDDGSVTSLFDGATPSTRVAGSAVRRLPRRGTPATSARRRDRRGAAATRALPGSTADRRRGESSVSESSSPPNPAPSSARVPRAGIRRADKIPAVLYGHGTARVHITLPGHEPMLALKHAPTP